MKREILLYDEIGPSDYGLLDAQWMVEQLNTLGPGDVTVRINSPGGSAIDGLAMYNALLRHPGAVTVSIDALAASAASIVAMAGATIEIADAAFVMVHNSWTFALGNASDLREQADTLGKVDDMQIAIFAARSKQTPEQIKQWLDAETWMTGAEAVSRGFATKIGQPLGGAKACLKPGQFRHAPAALTSGSLTPSMVAARASRRKLAMARAR